MRTIEIFTDEKVCCAATRSVAYSGLFQELTNVDLTETSIQTAEGAQRAKQSRVTKFPTVIIDGRIRVEPPLTPLKVKSAFDQQS